MRRHADDRRLVFIEDMDHLADAAVTLVADQVIRQDDRVVFLGDVGSVVDGHVEEVLEAARQLNRERKQQQ